VGQRASFFLAWNKRVRKAIYLTTGKNNHHKGAQGPANPKAQEKRRANQEGANAKPSV
jgi:hypothetical protein